MVYERDCTFLYPNIPTNGTGLLNGGVTQYILHPMCIAYCYLHAHFICVSGLPSLACNTSQSRLVGGV